MQHTLVARSLAPQLASRAIAPPTANHQHEAAPTAPTAAAAAAAAGSTPQSGTTDGGGASGSKQPRHSSALSSFFWPSSDPKGGGGDGKGKGGGATAETDGDSDGDDDDDEEEEEEQWVVNQLGVAIEINMGAQRRPWRLPSGCRVPIRSRQAAFALASAVGDSGARHFAAASAARAAAAAALSEIHHAQSSPQAQASPVVEEGAPGERRVSFDTTVASEHGGMAPPPLVRALSSTTAFAASAELLSAGENMIGSSSNKGDVYDGGVAGAATSMGLRRGELRGWDWTAPIDDDAHAHAAPGGGGGGPGGHGLAPQGGMCHAIRALSRRAEAAMWPDAYGGDGGGGGDGPSSDDDHRRDDHHRELASVGGGGGHAVGGGGAQQATAMAAELAARALLFTALSAPLSAPLYPSGSQLLRSASGAAAARVAPPRVVARCIRKVKVTVCSP